MDGAHRAAAILVHHHWLEEPRRHLVLRKAQAELARAADSARSEIASAHGPCAKRRIPWPRCPARASHADAHLPIPLKQRREARSSYLATVTAMTFSKHIDAARKMCRIQSPEVAPSPSPYADCENPITRTLRFSGN